MRWHLPGLRFQPDAAPAAAALAKYQNCVRSGRELAANTPGSSALPAPSKPGPLVSDDACPPSRPPSASQRNGCRDHCTARRIDPCFGSPHASPPSPSASILPPPVAHSRSHWWHRPESQSGRTIARLRTIDVCCHRCAAAYPPSAASLCSAGACAAFSLAPPGPLLAVLSAPTCSSAGFRAPRLASRESAACSDPRKSPGITATPAPPSPAAPVCRSACFCAGPPDPNSLPVPIVPATVSSSDPLYR